MKLDNLNRKAKTNMKRCANFLVGMIDKYRKRYDRKGQDMHDRLDILYDRISELEVMIADIKVKISGTYGEKITVNQLYKVLLSFDKMYFKMTDHKKRNF